MQLDADWLHHQQLHEHGHDHDHATHTHGIIDPTILRSRQGVRVVAASLCILAVATVLQLLVLGSTSSVSLLADIIHNGGDALTAVPLGFAFLLRSHRAERTAGFVIVGKRSGASAVVTLVEAVARMAHPVALADLWLLALAGLIGFAGNECAAIVRLRGGRRLHSAALTADGNHAQVDGLLSLSVVVTAILAVAGVPLVDPLVGLLITSVIARATWNSWAHHARSGKPLEEIDLWSAGGNQPALDCDVMPILDVGLYSELNRGTGCRHKLVIVKSNRGAGTADHIRMQASRSVDQSVGNAKRSIPSRIVIRLAIAGFDEA